MTEWMLEDVSRATPMRHMVLRYFNVAGADPKGRTGQSTPKATHLIKRAAQVVLGKVPHPVDDGPQAARDHPVAAPWAPPPGPQPAPR